MLAGLAAKQLAQAITAQRPVLADKIDVGVSGFVDHAIGKMVTICRAIRVARGAAHPSSPAGTGVPFTRALSTLVRNGVKVMLAG